MTVHPLHNQSSSFASAIKFPAVREGEKVRRKQIVALVILVIALFQVIELIGALFSHSAIDLETGILGLALCGIAILFNRLGNVAVVSLLLIAVVDLGCGVMLLVTHMSSMTSMAPASSMTTTAPAMTTPMAAPMATTTPAMATPMATMTHAPAATPMANPSTTEPMTQPASMEPMASTGLDVGDLPVFDVLLISELIAVSLLPAIWVFPVMLINVLFTLAVLVLEPHTPALATMLTSSMAFSTVMQPITLQIVVAVVSFIWVRSALKAIARADRAEEIAELQRREALLRQREIEHKRELDIGVEHLSQVLVHAANGQNMVQANLGQDNALWRIANALNLLLTRWRRASQAEQENQRLRAENFRLSEALHKARNAPSSQPRHVPRQSNFSSQA